MTTTRVLRPLIAIVALALPCVADAGASGVVPGPGTPIHGGCP